MALLKKMSMKTLLDATPAKTIKDMLASGAIKFNDIQVRIVGFVDGTKTGETTYGEYTAFLGSFVARVNGTDEEYESGTLFLDKSTTEAVKQKLDAHPDGVEIAVEIAIIPDPNPDSAKGYMYVTRPLQSEATVSRRQALLAKLKEASALALAAPAPAPDDKPKK